MKIIKLPSKNLQLGPLGDEILSQNTLKTANYTQECFELEQSFWGQTCGQLFS